MDDPNPSSRHTLPCRVGPAEAPSLDHTGTKHERYVRQRTLRIFMFANVQTTRRTRAIVTARERKAALS
jgi:hypothetical protein